MTDVWIVVIALTVSSLLVRAAGPAMMGTRDLPPRFTGVIDLLGPAVLTALIAVETLSNDGEIEPSASLVGLAAAAGVLLWRRSAMLPAIVTAAAVTAVVRALP